jgi:hypothetical protein
MVKKSCAMTAHKAWYINYAFYSSTTNLRPHPNTFLKGPFPFLKGPLGREEEEPSLKSSGW